jgi:hypothetical protein
MLIVAAAFGVRVRGLVTRKMLLPATLRFERGSRPTEFWIAAVVNAALACLALRTAIR